MRKFLAAIIVLALVLGLGTVVSAVEQNYEDDSTMTFTKSMTKQGVNPAETFNFTITPKEGAPAFNPAAFTIAVSQGEESATAVVGLPTFESVGVYEYTITETPGNTAGMTYDALAKTLKITVINNPEYDPSVTGSPKFLRLVTVTIIDGTNKIKVENFKNKFEAGNLEITKTVTGALGDKDREFNVTITLTVPSGKTIANDTVKVDGTALAFTSGVATINTTIKHGQTINITNIPYGVTYTVVEEDLADYVESGEVKTATPVDSEEQEVDLVNDNDTEIETGISLDNLPYILTMLVAFSGLVLFVVRRVRFSS